ncbi:MAG: toll/interleukin-1 receptor domain-containing protein [Anaerolineae bacterium]|nr:toll/interleukin-1 receptor domain-containing protein [Anaerolineae bacterium]
MANPDDLAILKQGVNVWNQWRKENHDFHPDFSDADLRDYKLNGADLRYADLSGAILTDVWLSRADLFECDLNRANLTGAFLNSAKLISADLSNSILKDAVLDYADLSGADLCCTDLSGADLEHTNLTLVNVDRTKIAYAKFASTMMVNVNLSNALGLDSAIHLGPSIIDIDTLYKSGGNIPEVFLRGCGVRDTMITFAKSLVGQHNDFYHCFISYSSVDEKFAKKLYNTLQNAGIRCWFAPDRILPGERIDSAIHDGIQQSAKVVFCASKSSLTEKWWVDFEVDKAFKKARDLQREQGKNIDVIIPLNLDNYIFSKEFDQHPKRSIFEMIHAENFVGWEEDTDKYNRQVERVILALRTDGGKESPPESKL